MTTSAAEHYDRAIRRCEDHLMHSDTASAITALVAELDRHPTTKALIDRAGTHNLALASMYHGADGIREFIKTMPRPAEGK